MVSCLDTAQAAETLIALLLPFGDEVTVSMSLVKAELIQLLGYLLPVVVKVIKISAPLVIDLEDGPQCLALPSPIMRIILSFSHLGMEL